jgi:pyruvate,water dikinase
MGRRAAKVKEFLNRILGAKTPGKAEPSEEDRATFKARYQTFRQLLGAGNRAQEAMAAMEEALAGDRPLGIHLVRSLATTASAEVFRMATLLEKLAPGAHRGLFDRFKELQAAVAESLAPPPPPPPGPFVLPLSGLGLAEAPAAGTKMAALGEAAGALGLAVPEGFVITAAAWRRFMEVNALQEELDRLIQVADAGSLSDFFGLSADLQRLILAAQVPDDLAEAILTACRELAAGQTGQPRFGLRSSLADPGAPPDASFAGQFRSELNASLEHVLHVYKLILASKYTVPAMTYRLERGLRDEAGIMAVGVQRMVEATLGGVAYSQDPQGHLSETVLIGAAWGLTKAVCDGDPADTYTVSRDSPGRILSRQIADKNGMFICLPREGLRRVPVPPDGRKAPCLSPAQAAEVAAMTLTLEAHFGRAVDVEWAYDPAGRLTLLQARPLALAPAAAMPLPDWSGTALAQGLPVCPGLGIGPAHLATRHVDVLTFPRGAVLVVPRPEPWLAALLPAAAAVVCEGGGEVCHLACVARELGVPAVFGAAGACARLVTGQVLTVDASAGLILTGHPEAACQTTFTRRLRLEGSPVMAVLQAAAADILPETLQDPESPTFKPANCKSLKDLGRYCHESAMREMFAFGSEHASSRHAARRLFCEVPMQFWVVDLEDGFVGEKVGACIALDQIASRPLHILWRGMNMIPWELPAMDARGFMAVLYEASANPNIDPASSSHYTQRNYFMVARHFVSLQSRFGFHSCSVETVIGDRPRENYLTFRFQGGAADRARRIRRAQFIRDILTHHGFSCRIIEDNLRARVEGLDQESMEERLAAVGYMVMHTRQLDMVMKDEASIAHYRRKFMADLEVVHQGFRLPD